MKQLKGAKRAEMLQDAANTGFDDVTVEILKSKTIFTQNLLLKGDTVAVSYTHLDVYKRQLLYIVKLSLSRLILKLYQVVS